MKLGKTSVQTSLFETIKKEEGVQEMVRQSPQISEKPPVLINPIVDTQLSEKEVHLVIQEKVSVVANRDGGLQNMEVNGSMMLKVNDPAKGKLSLRVSHLGDPNIQFKVGDHLFLDASKC
jgi:hypothetical protein